MHKEGRLFNNHRPQQTMRNKQIHPGLLATTPTGLMVRKVDVTTLILCVFIIIIPIHLSSTVEDALSTYSKIQDCCHLPQTLLLLLILKSSSSFMLSIVLVTFS